MNAVTTANDRDEPAPPAPATVRRYPDAVSGDDPSDDDVSHDDRDTGWGDRPADLGRDDDWYLRERPPHHG